MLQLDAKLPAGNIEEMWDNHIDNLRLVGPRNRPKYKVIVVGTGLAGASAASSIAAMGYKVDCFCFQDSPRRAHSIAAQGGINAAKNYRNDGDSAWRLFYDTQKGGDYRAREENVYRLAQLSTQIIDQAVSQGVPFAREYGGKLANRSFGGVLVERTFYCRGETGQQLLLGAYSALEEQIGAGSIKMHPRTEMLDLVVVDGRTRGIVVRDLVSGVVKSYAADAVVLATGGYGNVFYLSTNAKGCNVTATWRAYRRGAGMANPCFTQIHPTCIPASGENQSKLTLMSESLRNDGRIWVPKQKGETRPANDIPESDRYYYLEERYPRFGNLVPRDVAARNAKDVCDKGLGVGPTGYGVYLDFRDAIKTHGLKTIEGRYDNLFEMYQRITDENPYEVPMRIYPAVHYTMGGLWVDYNLMTNLPGLYAIGEANFSDHGANRLGASSLMQCLADGYFILPITIGDFLGSNPAGEITTDHEEFKKVEREVNERTNRLLSIKGKRTVQSFHRELGQIMWDYCGISRSEKSLNEGLRLIPELRQEFWENVNVPGSGQQLNQSLEHAGRVADFLEFGELMCLDGLHRDESCGCHLREEHQTEDGEAKRNDDDFAFTSVWEFGGEDHQSLLNKEPLEFKAPPFGTAELQNMKFKLHIWRQATRSDQGRMEGYTIDEVSPDMSFLELLDLLNENLTNEGKEPVAFDHDCREGVCGMCSMVINGQAHGPLRETTTCQLYMRHFEDGQDIYIEPWRAGAFPVVRDLVTDRTAFDRIIQAGGYISNHSGPKPEPNTMPINPDVAEQALDAAVCIGCGACVAACPNASGMLFVSAKVTHLGLLPQGQSERYDRAQDMVTQMQDEGFGSCRNYGECEAQCPKGISIANIGLLNRDYMKSTMLKEINPRGQMGTQ